MSSPQLRFTKNDEWYTPKNAVIPITKHLKPNSKIWCPFDTDQSEFVKVLSSLGHTVYNTHICNGEDFFEIKVPECDYIISNPPYSIKTKVLVRLFSLGIPFAMLINFHGIFDSRERFELFGNVPFEMMVLYPQVSYYNPVLKNTEQPPFQSAYICSGILDQQIMFESLFR